jgi:phosphatidylglycerophosphatase A
VSPLDRWRWLMISSFGLGCSPWAPGTVGTLGGVALAVGLQAASPTLGAALWAWSVAAAVLWLWGSLQSKFVARVIGGEDPGLFVLDEVVGYVVTVALLAGLSGRLPDGVDHAAAFFAFRVFDVLKLPPARRLEDLPGAWGIMADDVAAGVQAGLVLWLALPLVRG